jgi:hypothetical protein
MLQDGVSHMHEVLELVLNCTHDAALLCKAATLNCFYKQLALNRVHQNLPELLAHAVKQAPPKVACQQRPAPSCNLADWPVRSSKVLHDSHHLLAWLSLNADVDDAFRVSALHGPARHLHSVVC